MKFNYIPPEKITLYSRELHLLKTSSDPNLETKSQRQSLLTYKSFKNPGKVANRALANQTSSSNLTKKTKSEFLPCDM